MDIRSISSENTCFFWLNIMLIMCMVKTIRTTNIQNSANRILQQEARARWGKIIQKTNYPFKNINTIDLEIFLKYPGKIIFVKNLEEKKRENSLIVSEPDMETLVILAQNIYSAKPIVSVPTQTPKNRALNEIDLYARSMKKSHAYNNIMLNYRGSGLEYEKSSIYKRSWIFGLLKRKEEKNENKNEKGEKPPYTVLKQIIYYLYRKELDNAKGDASLAKKEFIRQLKDVELSIADLESTEINNKLIECIINSKMSEKDRDELEKEMVKDIDKLDKIIGSYMGIFDAEMPGQIKRKPYFYARYEDEYYRKSKKIRDVFTCSPRAINIDFSTLRDAFMGYNPKFIMEEYKNNTKIIHEKWENPIFVSSIVYKMRIYLAIEFKVAIKNDKDQIEIADEFRIVKFSRKNIQAVQEAKTIQDILQIDSIDEIAFTIDTIISSYIQAINITKTIARSLSPGHGFSRCMASGN